VSDKILKQYFELERVISGLFNIAKSLYDIEFKPLGIKSYDEEIRAFEVYKS